MSVGQSEIFFCASEGRLLEMKIFFSLSEGRLVKIEIFLVLREAVAQLGTCAYSQVLKYAQPFPD